ncbi:MAG: hypothetical protein PVSMB8_00150 [Vulcanimicrobiaceae bacterium]
MGAPTDAVVHFFVGARAVNEAATVPTDDVARQVVEVRSIAELVAAPIDDVIANTRGTFGRSVADAVPTPLDACDRQSTAQRVIVEDVGVLIDMVDAVSVLGMAKVLMGHTVILPGGPTIRPGQTVSDEGVLARLIQAGALLLPVGNPSADAAAALYDRGIVRGEDDEEIFGPPRP